MLEIRLLGEQRILAAGTPVETLHSTKALGLLAYLALHAGAAQRRQHLAGLFWPGSSEAQARTNLRRELHQLRAALPDLEDCLAADTTSLCWQEASPCQFDLLAFQHAANQADAAQTADALIAASRRALNAYGGELLPDLYEEWVLEARERLHRRCIFLLDRLITHLAERNLAEAITHARLRVELEPLEESGYRTLMRLQARAGDRAMALTTGRRCADVLARTLGVEPSSATRALCIELAAPEASCPPRPLADSQLPPLVGRDFEQAALEEAWSRVAQGPRLIAIAGEAGVGKTRLAEEFARSLQRRGEPVLRARCFPSRARLALAPVAEWLRSAALRPSLERLAPTWRHEVGRLVPELVGTQASSPAPLADAWQRRQFFEGLVRAIISIERPSLLMLDDIQWCDRETLLWLELLLLFEPTAPLLSVATLRSEELDDNLELGACQRRLQAQGIWQRLELSPLTLAQTAELASALHPESYDAAAARRLHVRTGGFPLFVVESLREGGTSTSRIEAVLEQRLAPLTPPAEELLGLIAALGRDLSLELMAAASELDETSLQAALDELWQHRLLREHTPFTYDIAHDLLREAAYRRLTLPHRRLLHRRLALALEQSQTGERPDAAALVAEQFEAGGLPGPALHYHVRAAEVATAVFALEDAISHYARALELLAALPAGEARDRQELALCEAQLPPLASLHGYAAPRVGAAIEHSVALAERLGETTEAARGRAALCWHRFVQGRMQEAVTLGQGLTSPMAQPGWNAQAVALPLFALGRHREALACLVRHEEAPDADDRSLFGFRAGVLLHGALAHVHWLLGHSESAAASATNALQLALASDHPFEAAIAHGYAAISYHLLGDCEASDEHAARVRRLSTRYGFAYYGEWGRILAGRLTGGAPGEALIRQGIERLRQQHAGARLPFWLTLLAEVLAETGRTEEALRVLGEARAWAEVHGDRWWLPELLRLEAVLGPAESVNTCLWQALDIATEQDAVALQLRAALDLSRCSHSGEDAEKAMKYLAALRTRASGCNPDALAAADTLLG
jgi:DNA-binding SARP family transcriptional activator